MSSIIHKCVTCRKLRGRLEEQRMADLPVDKLTPESPYTTVGLDVFGPWSIMTCGTRGGNAHSKRWAVLLLHLTHEILSTLMAEVMAIINARPLVSIPTDPDTPTVLTPAMLLTQMMSAVPAPSGNFCTAPLYGKQWKHVQCLATFWKR